MSGTANDRDQWLARRRIGSSDAAGCANLGFGSPEDDRARRKTPLQLFLEKTGRLAVPENEAMNWGKRLEATIAQAYMEREGIVVVPNGLQCWQHPEYEWMTCTPDFEGEDRLLEIKLVRSGKGWGEQYTDEIPEGVLAQVMHQMEVRTKRLCDVGALIGGTELRVYRVEFRPALVARLVEIEADFWDRLQRDLAPEPDWSHPRTPELLLALHTPKPGVEVRLDGEAATLAQRYKDACYMRSLHDEDADEAKARLVQLMGAAEVAHLPSGERIVRKEITVKERLAKSYSYSSFNIRKGKGHGDGNDEGNADGGAGV